VLPRAGECSDFRADASYQFYSTYGGTVLGILYLASVVPTNFGWLAIVLFYYCTYSIITEPLSVTVQLSSFTLLIKTS